MRRKKKRGNWRRSCASKREAACGRLEKRKRAGHRQLCRWPALFVWKGKGPAPRWEVGTGLFCWFSLPVMGKIAFCQGAKAHSARSMGAKGKGDTGTGASFSFAGRGKAGDRGGRSLSPRGPVAEEAGRRDGCGPSPGGCVERGRREVSAVFPWGLRRGKSRGEMARPFPGGCVGRGRGKRWRGFSPGPAAGEAGGRDGCALFPGTCAGGGRGERGGGLLAESALGEAALCCRFFPFNGGWGRRRGWPLSTAPAWAG